MSEYYNPHKTRNLYNPDSKKPFRLSRSKINLFLNCPRCFYLDRRIGVGRPPGYPFSLNSAVDALLKKEFDIHRAANQAHPLMEAYGLDAVPYQNEDLDDWRNSLSKGITFHHQPTNLLITGGVDDVWIDNKTRELIIVDYKATSKAGEVDLDADWQIDYKRQMEIYQWLFRRNYYDVSDTGYFVYCNGRKSNQSFDAKLDFDIKLIPYKGDDSWIEQTIVDIHTCLNDDTIPELSTDCDYCNYYKTLKKAETLGHPWQDDTVIM
jgi:hypothetical protein